MANYPRIKDFEDKPAKEAPKKRRWIDVLNDGGELPFKTPFEQYLYDGRTWNQADLAAEWEGISEPHEIAAIYGRPLLVLERQAIQAKLFAESNIVDFASPEYIRQANDAHIMRVLTEISDISATLDRIKAGGGKTKSRRTQKNGNWIYETCEEPYTPKELRDLRVTLDEKIKLHQLLTGQATEIQKIEKEVSKTTTNVTIAALIEDPRSADMAVQLAHRLSESRSNKSLPEKTHDRNNSTHRPGTGEGDPAHVRELRHGWESSDTAASGAAE